MKQSWQIERQRQAIFSAFLTSLLLCSTIAVGQTPARGGPNPPSTENGQTKGALPSQIVVPSCPKVRASSLQSTQASSGHHKVILAWDASVSTPDQKGRVVGYCLYRSKIESLAKQDPLCEKCERINSLPIAGTTCVDNLAKDNGKYYYVITAINAAGRISSSSNEAIAPIPDEKQPGTVPADFPLPPSCRVGD